MAVFTSRSPPLSGLDCETIGYNTVQMTTGQLKHGYVWLSRKKDIRNGCLFLFLDQRLLCYFGFLLLLQRVVDHYVQLIKLWIADEAVQTKCFGHLLEIKQLVAVISFLTPLKGNQGRGWGWEFFKTALR